MICLHLLPVKNSTYKTHHNYSLSPYPFGENLSNISMHPITLSLLAIWGQDSSLLLESKISTGQIMHAQLRFFLV